MDVDKYCEDGLLFGVVYEMSNGTNVISYMMFPIDYTEARVKEHLSCQPHNIKIQEVFESHYILKMKDEFLDQ